MSQKQFSGLNQDEACKPVVSSVDDCVSIDFCCRLGFPGNKYIYETAAYVDQECWGNLSNRPENFHPCYWGIETGHDLSAWWFKDYREIELIQGKEDLLISAWIREAETKAPWILFVHGLGSCKNSHTVLLPAAMMVHEGYSVMLLDLREHGASSKIDLLHTVGQEELQDVLSGWRWIHEVKGIAAKQIGVYGVSLGAGAVTLAFADDPQWGRYGSILPLPTWKKSSEVNCCAWGTRHFYPEELRWLVNFLGVSTLWEDRLSRGQAQSAIGTFSLPMENKMSGSLRFTDK